MPSLSKVGSEMLDGALPALDASSLTSIPAANITGTLPAISGTNLTNLDARDLENALPAISGASLTGLPSHTGNVAFPATQVASADANTLDDFEEGTWTPHIMDVSVSTSESQAYSTQVGFYTKVGNVVTLTGRVNTSSLGTVSGSLRFGIWPFAPKAGTASGVGFMGFCSGLNLGSTVGLGPLTFSLDPGGTAGPIWQWEVATGVGALDSGEWSADGNAYINAVYLTA